MHGGEFVAMRSPDRGPSLPPATPAPGVAAPAGSRQADERECRPGPRAPPFEDDALHAIRKSSTGSMKKKKKKKWNPKKQRKKILLFADFGGWLCCCCVGQRMLFFKKKKKNELRHLPFVCRHRPHYL